VARWRDRDRHDSAVADDRKRQFRLTIALSTRKFFWTGSIQREAAMRKALTATVLALFGLLPALASACEYAAGHLGLGNPHPLNWLPWLLPPQRRPSSRILKAPAPRRPERGFNKKQRARRNAKVAALSAN
jgi:hypothetical protein